MCRTWRQRPMTASCISLRLHPESLNGRLSARKSTRPGNPRPPTCRRSSTRTRRSSGSCHGEASPRLQKLATATVRSVAAGVIGVAFIQAILLGMGFMLAGIPAAGVLALLVMFLGILQVPALLVTLPAIAWMWVSGDGSTTSNIVFTIYLGIAGMADNVLKPLLLGRGVDAPMPVILIGALDGMVTGGIIGLFVGGVLLAVGYQLFMEWVDAADTERT